MDNDRQARIQQLSRVNRRRTVESEFIETLSRALEQTIEVSALVSFEESDSLLGLFREEYRAAQSDDAISYRKFFSKEEGKLIFELAKCLAHRLVDEEAYFLTKLGEDVGAVKVNTSALLNHAESVIDFDGDSISLLSNDRGQGLLIDSNPDDPEQTYEIAVWGDRWPLLALACN